jgi:hypothetical protein
MGLEGTHAQRLSQGEGLTVMGGGLVYVRGMATHGNITKESQSMRLVAASWMGVGEFEEAFGKGARLVHAADEEQGLAQLGEHKRIAEHVASGGNTF